MQTEELQTTWRNWRQCRLNYPGWVIAPESSRESLWAHTEYWIEPLLNHALKLQPVEALAMMFELNWRLETTLTPLFINQVEIISNLLDQIDLNAANGRELLKAAKLPTDMGWADIEESWMQLAFAVMRESREDLDAERFNKWTLRTQQLAIRNAAWRSRWLYELCLFNLFSFNQGQLRAILNEWKPTPELPFWEVKRASILAELGELKDAEHIAQEALGVIRTRLQPFLINYTLLSQEGWVMTLLKAIQLSHLKFENFETENYRARWNQLEAHACNPWMERRVMELAVSTPPPPPRIEKQEKDEFDPGRITVTRHLGSGMPSESYRPGFALLRMHEEAGLPMRCGMVDMNGKAIANAAKWIEPFAPLWSLVSIIRASNKEALSQTFDRVRIATLTEKEVTNLFNLLSRALTDAIQQVTLNPVLDTTFGGRGLPLFCELLSRLSIRLQPTDLQSLFEFATKLYAMTPRVWQLHECVKLLFERTVTAASVDQVIMWLPTLVSLPIPTEGGFEVFHDQRLPEPSLFLDWRGRTFDTAGRDPKLGATISLLIRVVNEGSAVARPRSLLRLAKLSEANLLTKVEEAALTHAVWARIDSLTGLPRETGLYQFALLKWPENQGGLSLGKLKQYLLSGEIPGIVQLQKQPDGKIQKSISSDRNSSTFIAEVFGATKSARREDKSNEKIDWNSKEIDILLRKTVRWWDRNKEFINDFDEVRDELSDLTDLLGDIVLPRLASEDVDCIALAKRMVLEMEEFKIPVLHALPGLVRFDGSLDVTAEKIRHGLMASEKKQVVSAIYGILLWAVHSKKPFPIIPEKLISALAIRILAMRQPSLETALAIMSELIRITPNLIAESDFNLLAVALQNLLSETELQSQSQHLARAQSQPSALPLTKRPYCRQLGARLAFSLFQFAKEKNIAIPESVEAWRIVCQKDPLPEVRREWKTM